MTSSQDTFLLDGIAQDLEQIREERSEAFAKKKRDESVVCVHNHKSSSKSSLLPAMENYAQTCHCYRCKELRKLSSLLRKARQHGDQMEIKKLSDSLSSIRSSMLRANKMVKVKTTKNGSKMCDDENREADNNRVAKLLKLSATLRQYSKEALAKSESQVEVSDDSMNTEETSLSSSIDSDPNSEDGDLARPLPEGHDNIDSHSPSSAATPDFPIGQERSYLIGQLQSLLRERQLEPGEDPTEATVSYKGSLGHHAAQNRSISHQFSDGLNKSDPDGATNEDCVDINPPPKGQHIEALPSPDPASAKHRDHNCAGDELLFLIPARADPDGVLKKKDRFMEKKIPPDPVPLTANVFDEKLGLSEQCRSSDPAGIVNGIVRGVEIETAKNIMQDSLEMTPGDYCASFSSLTLTENYRDSDQRGRRRRSDPDGAMRGTNQLTHSDSRPFMSKKQHKDKFHDCSRVAFGEDCTVAPIKNAEPIVEETMVERNKKADPEGLPGFDASLSQARLFHPDEKRRCCLTRELGIVDNAMPNSTTNYKFLSNIDEISSHRSSGVDPDGVTIGQSFGTFRARKQNNSSHIEANQLVKTAESYNCQDVKKGRLSQPEKEPAGTLTVTKDTGAQETITSANINSSIPESSPEDHTKIADLDDKLLLELIKKASWEQEYHDKGKKSASASHNPPQSEGQGAQNSIRPNCKTEMKRRECQGNTTRRIFQGRPPRGQSSRRKDSRIAATVFRSWDLINDEAFE